MNITIEYHTKTRMYYISDLEIIDGVVVTKPFREAGYEYYKALRLFNKILRGEE